MTGLSSYDAGIAAATEAGREMAENGRAVVAERLRQLLAATNLSPPTDEEIDRGFDVRISVAYVEVREVALVRGLSPEQADDVSSAFLVAATAGRTQ
ncbi:hypothetical protein [Methylopila sp. 73B]|uniref:hypothetical protein n=1 Tax=Methylopila sp. 73B TaxID=1120792 RepID=UPI000380EB13|nr:hypothetical protein [Methylopila sp. 73B]